MYTSAYIIAIGGRRENPGLSDIKSWIKSLELGIFLYSHFIV